MNRQGFGPFQRVRVIGEIVSCTLMIALAVSLGVSGCAAANPSVREDPRIATEAVGRAALAVSPLTGPAAQPKPAAPSGVRVDRKSATTLEVWWSKVSGAKSYKVYRLVKKKWKLVKVTGSLSWVNKKLPKRKVQQYRVVACGGTKGKGACGGVSSTVSAITNVTGKDAKSNVRGIRFHGLPGGVAPHDEWNFDVELTPTLHVDSSQVPVSTAVRMVSSDPSVVAVKVRGYSHYDATGLLTAKRFGSALITVTAHNGVTASFWVHVKDMACPVDLRGPWPLAPTLVPLVQAHGDRICALARYSLAHLEVKGTAKLDEKGNLEMSPGLLLPDDLTGFVREVLSTGSSFPVEMEFWSYGVDLLLYLNDVPWGQSGAEREVLGYRNYLAHESLNAPGPLSHWVSFHDVSNPSFR